MALRQYQTSSGKFINETGTRQYQTAGGAFINDTSVAASTAFYSRGRVANQPGAAGGAAKSRARIVNAGSV